MPYQLLSKYSSCMCAENLFKHIVYYIYRESVSIGDISLIEQYNICKARENLSTAP